MSTTKCILNDEISVVTLLGDNKQGGNIQAVILLLQPNQKLKQFYQVQ